MRNWFRGRRDADEASCMQVARVLQSYLDGQVDDVTAQRVSRHLEHCRRCGLEFEAYWAIKDAIARRARVVDPAAVERLRELGERLAEEGPGESASSPA